MNENFTANNLPRVHVLHRIDAGSNCHRFYVVSLEETLFNDVAVVRQWGRIGRIGSVRFDLHANPVDACEALETWLKRKLRRGYRRICGSA